MLGAVRSFQLFFGDPGHALCIRIFRMGNEHGTAHIALSFARERLRINLELG